MVLNSFFSAQAKINSIKYVVPTGQYQQTFYQHIVPTGPITQIKHTPLGVKYW